MKFMCFYKAMFTRLGLLILSLVIFTSCVSRKKIAYFQFNENSNFENIRKKRNNLKLKPNDELTISVSAPEQDAASPFNLPVMAVSNSGISNTSVNAAPQLQRYLVDSNGRIDFPILGKVKVENMSIEDLKKSLSKEISNYVKDPIVTIQLVNFQITVLGEVNRPNTFNVNDQYISLPNALGLAGDLTIYGRRDNILIIREEDSLITRNRLNITDNNIIDSPYYYLKQDDIVYVEPNRSQRQGAIFNRNSGVYVSIASLLISLVVLLTK